MNFFYNINEVFAMWLLDDFIMAYQEDVLTQSLMTAWMNLFVGV